MATVRQLIGNVKGERGETGLPSEVIGSSYSYQLSDDGENPPEGGVWLPLAPTEQGKYLWTRNVISYNSGDDSVIYTVAYQGRDGSFAGDDDMAKLKQEVQELNDRTTPISKGGTSGNTLQEAQDNLGITDLGKKYSGEIESINTNLESPNLIVGSRDFLLGSKEKRFSFKADGFFLASSVVSFYKDADGFTVAKLSNYGQTSQNIRSLFSPVVEGLSVGDTLTISFEFMVDNISEFDNERIMILSLFDDSATAATTNRIQSVDLRFSQLGYSLSGLASGVWYKAVYSLKLAPTRTPVGDMWFTANPTIFQNGSINFKKLSVQKGAISSPSWKPALCDLALEPINDITSGVNLIRGSRDFALSTVKFSGNTVLPFNGFAVSRGTVTRELEDDGLVTLSVLNATSTGLVYGNAIKGISPGDQYTLAVDFMVPNLAGLTYPFDNLALNFYGLSGSNVVQRYYIKATDNIKAGVWYKALLVCTVPDTATESSYMFAHLFTPQNIEMKFRKCILYEGDIRNPEWAPNPLDYASSYAWDSGAPNLLGVLPSERVIVENTDLNNITAPGSYGCLGTVATTLQNCPTEQPFRMTVDVINGQTTNGLVQTLRVAETAEYIRSTSTGAAGWTPWRNTYGTSTVRPYEGGGTNANSLSGAKQNLGITALEARIATLEEQIKSLTS